MDAYQELLRKIHDDTRLAAILSRLCDFELLNETDAQNGFEDWIILENRKEHQTFAVDGSGGMFAMCGSNSNVRPVIYASSEGQYSVIGKNIQETLQIMAQLPYWFDLFKFSGSGLLSEMKRAASLLEEDYQKEDPELEIKRRYVISKLELGELDDPISLLYENAKKYSTQFTVIANDGSRYETLFNTFVVEDNPYWKNRLQ